MKTRAKILSKSKELFNTHGINNTTLRQIATSLGMSQGNLNYHFKTRQAIIEVHYFELVEKMDMEMSMMVKNFSLLSMLYHASARSMLLFYDYRFLIRDLYFIFRENETIKSHYLNLQKIREEQFMMLFNTMIEQQILRGEEFVGEYKRFYERLNILGDNWINTCETLKPNIEHPIQYYQRLLFEVLYPYLTKKGKEQFKAIFD